MLSVGCGIGAELVILLASNALSVVPEATKRVPPATAGAEVGSLCPALTLRSPSLGEAPCLLSNTLGRVRKRGEGPDPGRVLRATIPTDLIPTDT
jgi:hypothetical protein